jgi:hypothetical protein
MPLLETLAAVVVVVAVIVLFPVAVLSVAVVVAVLEILGVVVLVEVPSGGRVVVAVVVNRERVGEPGALQALTPLVAAVQAEVLLAV